jgi:hypothetical protein
MERASESPCCGLACRHVGGAHIRLLCVEEGISFFFLLRYSPFDPVWLVCGTLLVWYWLHLNKNQC